MVLAGALILASVIASIFVLVDAFEDSIMTGFLCLLCGLYFLWYALFEFEHKNKWLIVATSLFGGTVGGFLLRGTAGP